MKLRHACLIALLVSLAGPVASADPIMTKSGPLAGPPPGRGLVVFYRPGLQGAIMGCTVHEGSQELVRLGSKKYYAVVEAPGVHEYFTNGELHDRLRLEIEEDETYFVRCAVIGGMWGGRANLEPTNREAFIEKAPRLNLWTPGR